MSATTIIGEPADVPAVSIPEPPPASVGWLAVAVGVGDSISGDAEGTLVGELAATGVKVLVGPVVAAGRGVLVGAAVGVGMIASTPVGVTRTNAVGADVGLLTLIS